ncbi:type IX secretion system membrane protein PorP/SprF [Flammeovirgaceae bacterium SG7u.111]|nr:type IX secretion system membrane protein PorP/SprF [Flammeovirgaceae bacterium SG7u.132]WPO34096.1 type IX secretion system membrane protein PorP/SprF [Flammeovirgaceae bacterium SG7u.111]
MKIILAYILTLLSFGLMTSQNAQAQDPNLTQFYAAPLYMNPAFTGAVSNYRLATTYRRHLMSIPGGFQTNLVSFDKNLEDINSGIGVMFMNDRLSTQGLSSNHINLSYAYEVGLNQNTFFRAGLSGGYVLRSVGYGDLLFGDQIDNGGDSQETFASAQTGMVDISAGFLIYSEKYWAGLSLFHLNQPKKITEAGEMSLPLRFNLHAGLKIPIDKFDPDRSYLSPAVHYQSQGSFDQLDAGVNFYYKPIMLGAWYRGMPTSSSEVQGLGQQDSINFLAGIQQGPLWIGYSYDMRVFSSRSFGPSHEISIILEPKSEKSNGKSRVRCPAFYGVN